jgi:hypothetical protein
MEPVVVATLTALGVVPIVSAIKHWISANRSKSPVKIKLATGQTVTLDLDGRLPSAKAQELVQRAARSVGNPAELDLVVRDSHKASEIARQAS